MIWSVSVDLDGLGCYAAIHGLSLRLDERAQRAVPEVALQRFCELFQGLGVRATFFAIGREAAIAPASLKAAAGAGHEIGSHSYGHDYALSRRTREEITQTMRDLRACGVDILTIGQYLRPTPRHLDIVRYYHPDEFAELKAEGLALGFKHVESGPLVRSSYHAHEHAAIASGQ